MWVDVVKMQFGIFQIKYVCVGYCFGVFYVCDEFVKDIVIVGVFVHFVFFKEFYFYKVQSRLVVFQFVVWECS